MFSRSICYYAFDKIEPTKWKLLSIKRKVIDIRRHWIEPRPCYSWNEYTYNIEKSFYSTVAGSISSKRIEGTRMYLRWFMLLFFCCPPVIQWSFLSHQRACCWSWIHQKEPSKIYWTHYRTIVCLLSQQHTWCDALIVQAVYNVLNVTIHINESIEGWAPVTVISPISGQQGTTVNTGRLDWRHYVSAFQLDYYNDSISGYEISGVTNVNNNIIQSLVIID